MPVKEPAILKSKNVYIGEDGYYKIKSTAPASEKKAFAEFMANVRKEGGGESTTKKSSTRKSTNKTTNKTRKK